MRLTGLGAIKIGRMYAERPRAPQRYLRFDRSCAVPAQIATFIRSAISPGPTSYPRSGVPTCTESYPQAAMNSWAETAVSSRGVTGTLAARAGCAEMDDMGQLGTGRRPRTDQVVLAPR